MNRARLSLIAGIVAVASALIAPLALAESGGSVRFVAWGMRTAENGRIHVKITSARSFRHCQSASLVRITANYAYGREVRNGTLVKVVFYLNHTRFYSYQMRVDTRGRRTFAFYVTSVSGAYPDGLYSAVLSVAGGPTVSRSIRVSSTSCGSGPQGVPSV